MMGVKFDSILGKLREKDVSVSPLTTKGDVFTYDTADARLGIGNNDEVLTADSAQGTGLKWAAAAGGAYSRSATLIVAASDSKDTTNADYFCDGTDDEVQINQAISDLPAGGGRVLLMEGTFTIGASISITRSKVALVGLGRLISYIYTTANIKMIDIPSYQTGIEIRNLHIRGPGSGNTSNYGIYFYSPAYSVIDNCYIEYIGKNAIYMRSCTYSKVSNNYFYRSYDSAIYHFLGNRNVIHDNIFNTNTRGMYIRGDNIIITSNNIFQTSSESDILVANAFDIIIANNVLSGGYCLDIRSSSYRCSIVGNIVNARYGIRIRESSYDNTISSNVIWGNSDYGIECRGAGGNAITGNNIYDVRGTSGIYIHSGSHKNTITGNKLSKMDEDGIRLNASRHNIVSGNHIHDCSEDTNDTYSGILLTGTSTYNVVSNNRISGDAANKHKYGIREAAAADDYNLIHGNICTDAVTTNISTQGANTVSADNIAP